jgi:cell division septum initiation protein DivIVA
MLTVWSRLCEEIDMAKWKEIPPPELLRERIEQLAATNEELSNCVAVLEAKLNKAMGALEKVQAFVRDLEPHADRGHTLVPALREACETLKEIKGDTDE